MIEFTEIIRLIMYLPTNIDDTLTQEMIEALRSYITLHINRFVNYPLDFDNEKAELIIQN